VHPVLLEIGPVTIYSYGVLLAAAYLAGLWMAARRSRRAGIDPSKVLDLGIWVIIAALVGAKALLFIVDHEQFTSSWAQFVTLLRSGGVFYGGLIAAVVVCIHQLRRHRLPLWRCADLFAPGIALGYAIGRTGCLLAGCCYGAPSEVAWAITFTDPIANLNVGTPLNVPLHPTQIYEAAAGLVLLAALVALERRGAAFPGRTFWLFVLFYAASRFVIEFFRGDDRGMPVGGLSTSQLISIVLLPLSLFMLRSLSRRARRPRPRRGGRPDGAPGARRRKPTLAST
jgi:phosphatidylglycerol:prolipoprotein diacylglycerol transferase